MAQHLRYARFEVEHGPIYGDLLDRLEGRYPELVTIDVAEQFDETSDIETVESLYVQRGEGGRYSAKTNERIADILLETVFEEAVHGPVGRS